MCEEAWKGFTAGAWQDSIDVNDFIIRNYNPYEGNEEFLTAAGSRTEKLWDICRELIKEETLKGGVLDVDTKDISSIISHNPGYIEKSLEVITGLQTDKPLKRAVLPFGGIRMVRQACEEYGYKLPVKIDEIFENYRKTHNDGVFSAYTAEMKKARKCGVITGLPDAYGRGRIIGDYRRVALYGVEKLIYEKVNDLNHLTDKPMDDELIRQREEVYEQINSLNELMAMASTYGYNISNPAKNAFEAVQWTYFAFLAAMKETNGAANSLGRVSNFFDIYIERDLNNGELTEESAQELIDQFVIKLRLIRHLRTPEYNELFAGDPVWITESLGGMGNDGRHMVTKTSYRMLKTLYNLGSAPEPNLTILWSQRLPLNFKKFCSKVSMDTSAIQYENDDLMRPVFGDDYGISCCVSAMKIGRQTQFFGARCNIPKLLLLSLNGGRDEISGEQVGPYSQPYEDEYLDFEKVITHFKIYQKWLAELYVNTMNIIHYMHDRYAYERVMMALHDTDVERFMAFGMSGLSVAADSLSAIRFARVKAVRNENGLITDFVTEGDYPKYGNDDDRVDRIAVKVVTEFYNELRKHKTYKNAKHTLSILTITSNVVYGKKTGSTPDGRKKGQPFAPGANPMHGRDTSGIAAAMNTIAKLPYKNCLDGISFTASFLPAALGRDNKTRIENLISLMDGYFKQGGHHINVNVIEKELLMQAMEEPEKFPQLTIRVSGYAVNFVKLTKEQQLEVLARTFHNRL
ncbi:MAG: formate C-acetyltransferase [Bacillota bacterium]|nr:formate C-acetyltransferase [Bacillota bacterium]